MKRTKSWKLLADAPNASKGHEICDEQDFIEAFYPRYYSSSEIAMEGDLHMFLYNREEIDVDEYLQEGETDDEAIEEAQYKWLEERTGLTREDCESWAHYKEHGQLRVKILETSINEFIKWAAK